MRADSCDRGALGRGHEGGVVALERALGRGREGGWVGSRGRSGAPHMRADGCAREGARTRSARADGCAREGSSARSARRMDGRSPCARRKRHVTTAMMCERLGVAKSTYVRVEKGDPTVAMGVYAMALFVLGVPCEAPRRAGRREPGRAGAPPRRATRPEARAAEEGPHVAVRATLKVFLGDEPRLLGRLRYNAEGARENASFEYDASWLAGSSSRSPRSLRAPRARGCATRRVAARAPPIGGEKNLSPSVDSP